MKSINVNYNGNPENIGIEFAKNNKKTKTGSSIYAGNLNPNGMSEEILNKKKQAQDMALKLVMSVYAGDKEMDDDEEARNLNVKNLTEENAENRKIIENIQAEKDKLLEQGESADSDMIKNLNNAMKEYTKKIEDNDGEIISENAIVRGMKIERLKSHAMVDANKQGDKILEAASKEIIGMITEDVKENIDETMEEVKEENQEKKEEKIEEEKRLEEIRDENNSKEKALKEERIYELDSILEDVKKVENSNNSEQVKKSLDQVINELKLTTDDIKGAVVDEKM